MNDTQFYRALFELEAKGLIEIDDEDEVVRLTQAGISSHNIYKHIQDPGPIGIVLKAIGEAPDDTDN